MAVCKERDRESVCLCGKTGRRGRISPGHFKILTGSFPDLSNLTSSTVLKKWVTCIVQLAPVARQWTKAQG